MKWIVQIGVMNRFLVLAIVFFVLGCFAYAQTPVEYDGRFEGTRITRDGDDIEYEFDIVILAPVYPNVAELYFVIKDTVSGDVIAAEYIGGYGGVDDAECGCTPLPPPNGNRCRRPGYPQSVSCTLYCGCKDGTGVETGGRCTNLNAGPSCLTDGDCKCKEDTPGDCADACGDDPSGSGGFTGTSWYMAELVLCAEGQYSPTTGECAEEPGDCVYCEDWDEDNNQYNF